MKEYVFERQSYWTSNGCDCCEADETVFYTCTSHPVDIDNESSREDCTISAIMHSSGSLPDWCLREKLYDLEIDELNRLATDLGVFVSIYGGDDED